MKHHYVSYIYIHFGTKVGRPSFRIYLISSISTIFSLSLFSFGALVYLVHVYTFFDSLT